MEKKKKTIFCDNGHIAKKLCISEKCINSSAACSQNDCKYSTVHKRCQFVGSQEMVQMLIEKAKQTFKDVDKLIITTLEKQIKNLQIILEEHLERIDDYSLRLKGDDKKLYLLLMSQQTRDLLPQLVSKVVNRLKEKETANQEFERLKQIVEKMQNNQQIGLKLIGNWRVEDQEIQTFEKQQGFKNKPFSFADKLCNIKVINIQNGGKAAKVNKPNGYDTFALISPPISATNSIKILLKATTMTHIMNIGVARRQLIKMNWRFPKEQRGLQFISSNGRAYNSFEPQKHGQMTTFKFKQGDELEMGYDSKLNKLVIRNLSTSELITLGNIPNLTDELYYCVGMYAEGDKFEIIEKSK